MGCGMVWLLSDDLIKIFVLGGVWCTDVSGPWWSIPVSAASSQLQGMELQLQGMATSVGQRCFHNKLQFLTGRFQRDIHFLGIITESRIVRDSQ